MSVSTSGISKLLSSLSSDPNRRGRQFEVLCRWFLLNDPVYRSQLANVWLWRDWPERWGDSEAGIDLVAETKDGQLWAIQAKCYDEANSITKRDVDSFLSESARPEFSFRLLIGTTDRIASHAARAMRTAEKLVGYLLRHDLDHSEVAWPSSIEDLRPGSPTPKTPRPHQQEAIDAAINGFRGAGRGQVIMACGTGKTLAAVWIAEAMGVERTIVLLPSLSLMKQTIREWLANSAREFEYLPVCSDDTVRDRDQIVGGVDELGFPATGDPNEVTAFVARPGPRVVFSTYQSSPIVAATKAEFDLAIADEAHRCAGPATSDFVTILHDDQIRVSKRLFMTATPRIFTGRLKKEGANADFEIVSMDDEERFGSVFHRLTFGEAIERDLLSDYRVLVIGVDDKMYRQYAEQGEFVTTDGQAITDARSLAAQIGVARAIRDYDLRRVITFHSRVSSAKQFAESLPSVIEWMPENERPSGSIWANHVSGTGMTSGDREIRLGHLRKLDLGTRGILSNARCLAEGVDVPTLDGVAFIDPKRSAIDIAQAVGRAIRKAEEKTLGTIVIPVFVGDAEDAEEALSESRFKAVWDVLRALREHDAALGEALDRLRRSLGRKQHVDWRLPEKLILEVPTSVGDDFARAFETRVVESTTSSWESVFGLLEQFVEREGHSRVPQRHVEEEFHLGAWVVGARTAYKQGRLGADRARRLAELAGWVWDVRIANFDQGCGVLAEFVRREGHAGVPVDHVEGDYRLGTWVANRRLEYRNNLLSAERISQLEDWPGWIWNPIEANWENGYERLEAFARRKGHTDVPRSHVEDDFKLGQWVRAQRASHSKQDLDLGRARRLEALPGWEWEWAALEDQAWKHGFSHLAAFVEREGHARVTRLYEEKGFELGKWVHKNRNYFRRGELSATRIQKLEGLSGWEWSAVRRALAHLRAFIEREGHSWMPKDHLEDGFKLGQWVSNLRSRYQLGEMLPERVAELEALRGWSWDSSGKSAMRWDRAFSRLVEYTRREGDCSPPRTHAEGDVKLGSWVTKQRRRYKDGKLSAEQRARLESIPGWAWDLREGKWEDGFARLTDFARREGHARVPADCVEDGFNLGQWVSNRRNDFKCNSLDDERVRKIEAVPGWLWNARDQTWEEGIEKLKAFARREGHARVPRSHNEGDYTLGRWVNAQRTSYQNGKLSEERTHRLEAVPGWVWLTRARRRT